MVEVTASEVLLGDEATRIAQNMEQIRIENSLIFDVSDTRSLVEVIGFVVEARKMHSSHCRLNMMRNILIKKQNI